MGLVDATITSTGQLLVLGDYSSTMYPREAARRELYPRLEVDGFGKHDDVRPLEDVRTTVRKMFYVD